jgi:hypothetical protein
VYNVGQSTQYSYYINICFILLLTLHVSALILGHHQAYNDIAGFPISSAFVCGAQLFPTRSLYNDISPSSLIVYNFNMDPNCVHVSFKCINLIFS